MISAWAGLRDLDANPPAGVFPWMDYKDTSQEYQNVVRRLTANNAESAAGNRGSLCTGVIYVTLACDRDAAKKYGPWKWCGRCRGHQTAIYHELKSAAASGDISRYLVAMAHPDVWVRQVWAAKAPAEVLTAETINAIFDDDGYWVSAGAGLDFLRQRRDDETLPVAAIEEATVSCCPEMSALAVRHCLAPNHPELTAVNKLTSAQRTRDAKPPVDDRTDVSPPATHSEAFAFILGAINASLSAPHDMTLFDLAVRFITPPRADAAEVAGPWAEWLTRATVLTSAAAEAAATFADEACHAPRILTAGRISAIAQMVAALEPKGSISYSPSSSGNAEVSIAALRAYASAGHAAAELGDRSQRLYAENLSWAHVNALISSAVIPTASQLEASVTLELSEAVADLMIMAARHLDDPDLFDAHKYDPTQSRTFTYFAAGIILTAEDCARVADEARSRPYYTNRGCKERTLAGEICVAMLNAPYADIRTGQALLASRNSALKTWVIRCDSDRAPDARLITDKDLERIAGLTDVDTLKTVLESRHVTPQAVQILAASPNPLIRERAVRIPREVPEAVLTLLSMDPDREVSDAALRRLKNMKAVGLTSAGTAAVR